MNLHKKKNLLRRMSILVSLLLAISSLSACSGDDDDDDKSDNAGTVTAKSIVGVWNVLGTEDTFIFTDSGKGRYSNHWSNGTTHMTDFSYEMAGDRGYFVGFGSNTYGDYSFEFMGPYIVIPTQSPYNLKYSKFRYLLYKKENVGKGSLSDFKGEFSNDEWGTIAFNGDGTGKTNWRLDADAEFTYKSEGKNYAHIYYSKEEVFRKRCEVFIYEDILYLDTGSDEGVSHFTKVK